MNTTNPKGISQQTLRIYLLLPALLLALLIAPGIASAHAEVKSSTPPNGSTAGTGLTEVTIIFTEDISPDQSSAQLVGPAGAMTSGVRAAVDRADRTKMTVTTPPLADGKYTVKWAAVTEDDNGHTNGDLSFTVSESATSGPSSGNTGNTGSTPGSSNNQSMPPTGVGDLPPLAGILAGAALALAILGAAVRRRANA